MAQNLIRVSIHGDDAELADLVERSGAAELVEEAPQVTVWRVALYSKGAPEASKPSPHSLIRCRTPSSSCSSC